MGRLIVLLLAILVVQHVTAIDTVPELNISQYLGRWYQVYGNLIADSFTKANCKCSTANCIRQLLFCFGNGNKSANLLDPPLLVLHSKGYEIAYGALSNGSITVLNSCHLNSADGQLNSIEGYAYRPVEAEEGKLKVVFDSVPQSSDGGSYWVVQLGPPTFSGNQYQYAVVTDPCKLSLFVLARNVTEFKMNYDNRVREKLKKQGFVKFYNRPTEVYQGSDCMYTHHG